MTVLCWSRAGQPERNEYVGRLSGGKVRVADELRAGQACFCKGDQRRQNIAASPTVPSPLP
jgi:hypothetical protein